MQPDQLRTLLRHLEFTVDGERFLAPEGGTTTVFVALPGETLTIDRVAALELADELVRVRTHRREQFATTVAAVAAVRVAAER